MKCGAAPHYAPWPTATLFLMLMVGACATTRLGMSPAPSTCATLDSLYAGSGLTPSLIFGGKATVDANQYQVRGLVHLQALPSGDILFEFTSSLLFGSQIEDFFVSLSGDTLRVLDRERGRFYQGSTADAFLQEALGLDFDVKAALRLALGGKPPCAAMKDVHVVPGRSTVVRGRLPDGDFKADFRADGGRLEEVTWPVPGDPQVHDRMRCEYRWARGNGGWVLERIVIWLEGREWRCRLTSASG